MQRLTDEQIEKLDTDHADRGGVAAVHTVMGTAAFRRAKRVELQRFNAAILGDDANLKATASYVLAVATVVHPSQDEFKRWCDEAPAIPTACIKSIMKHAGSEVEEYEKKSNG